MGNIILYYINIFYFDTGNVRFTTVPLKAISNPVGIRYRFFVYMVSSQKLLEHVLCRKAYELPELNTFKPRKTTKSSTLLIRQRFQGYHFKSSMFFFIFFLLLYMMRQNSLNYSVH